MFLYSIGKRFISVSLEMRQEVFLINKENLFVPLFNGNLFISVSLEMREVVFKKNEANLLVSLFNREYIHLAFSRNQKNGIYNKWDNFTCFIIQWDSYSSRFLLKWEKWYLKNWRKFACFIIQWGKYSSRFLYKWEKWYFTWSGIYSL